MKNLFLIVAVCFCAACKSEKVNTPLVITGKTLPGEKVTLQQNQNGMFRAVATTTADSTGDFTLEQAVEEMSLLSISAGLTRKYVPVLGGPGEQVEADLSGEEVVFSGKTAERNSFLQQLNGQRLAWTKAYPGDFRDLTAYRRAQQQQYEACRDYLEAAALEDAEALGILKADAMVQYYGSLLKYPFLYQLMTGNTVELPGDYYDFVKEVDLSSPYLNRLGNINSFLQELFTAMEESGNLETAKDNYLLKRAGLITQPALRERYILNVIATVELSGYNQYLGQQITALMPLMESAEGKAKLEELARKQAENAGKNERFNAGQPAPGFTGMDVEGNQHRLSDYKGKVVVVDVWNTGCKPCIAEIPYLKRLEREFEDRDVVFISYSLDTDTEVWKQFLAAHQQDGNQWINTEAFKSAFAKDYNIRFIPRFLVIGKDGNIVDVYAPRPSNLRLAQLIEEALAE